MKIFGVILLLSSVLHLSEGSSDSNCGLTSHVSKLRSCECLLNEKEHLQVSCKIFFLSTNTVDKVQVQSQFFTISVQYSTSEKIQQNSSQSYCLRIDRVSINKNDDVFQDDESNYTIEYWHRSVQLALLMLRKVDIEILFPDGSQPTVGILRDESFVFDDLNKVNQECPVIVEATTFEFEDPVPLGVDYNPDQALNFLLKRWHPYLRNATISKLLLTVDDRVKNINKEIFNWFVGLRVCELSINNLGWNIMPDYLFPSSSITSLDFSNGHLESVNIYAFKLLHNVEELNLSGNKLGYIPAAVFQLPYLNVLDLRNNRPSYGFRLPYKHLMGLSNLVAALNVSSRTLIKNVTEYAIQIFNNFLIHQPSSNATVMLLSGSPINDLPEYAFLNSFKELRSLFMDNAKIQYISNNAFANLSELKELHLGNNIITSFQNNTFLGLIRLSNLNLSGNSIYFTNDILPFHPLENLTVLDLSYNNISYLNNRLFESNPLEQLILEYNKIKVWNDVIFFNISTLHFLNLAQNEIETITKHMILDLSNVNKTDLKDNPFNCSSCSLLDMQEWIKYQSDNSSYICRSTEDSERLHVLDAIYQEDLCIIIYFNYVLKLMTPLIAVFLLKTLVIYLLYRYRWYIRYFFFLCRLKVSKHTELEEGHKFLFDAFVSYNAADNRWVAKELVSRLEGPEMRLRLCVHDRDFLGGAEITSNIIESIEQSRKVIFVLSEQFLSSQWCMLEMHLSQHRFFQTNRSGQILIKLCPLPKRCVSKKLQYLMDTRTYIEWPEEPNAQPLFWKKLERALSPSPYDNII